MKKIIFILSVILGTVALYAQSLTHIAVFNHVTP